MKPRCRVLRIAGPYRPERSCSAKQSDTRFCARSRSRKDWIEKELARLLGSDDRASLHSSAQAYVTEWRSAPGQMLEALQFGREAEADALILRTHSALKWRWSDLEAEVACTATNVAGTPSSIRSSRSFPRL